MASYDNNVYYHPDQWGLEVFGGLDEPNMSYEFNEIVVWKHTASGQLYWAQSSGCSCPSPFEEYNSLNELSTLDWDDINEFREFVRTFGTSEWRDDPEPDDFKVDKVELLAKVSSYLREQELRFRLGYMSAVIDLRGLAVDNQ